MTTNRIELVWHGDSGAFPVWVWLGLQAGLDADDIEGVFGYLKESPSARCTSVELIGLQPGEVPSVYMRWVWLP